MTASAKNIRKERRQNEGRKRERITNRYRRIRWKIFETTSMKE